MSQLTPAQELERRLAALRAPKPTNNSASEIAEAPTPPAAKAALTSLEAPKSFEEPPQVETKNISDDDVERYLASFSAPSTLPTTTPHPASNDDQGLNAALASYESLAPSFTSAIEVTFLNPAKLAGPSRTEDEDEQLVRMLRDELSIENAHGKDREARVSEWEKRMQGLEGVVPGSGGTTGAAVSSSQLGEAPKAVDLDEFKKGARDSDEESEEESEKDSESEKSDEESD
ncbi:hypothetical protein T439DRAFT_381263 [Meredithblackwellia eburnea MCA 4105]